MDERLFQPPGPAVTEAESRKRRAVNTAAQEVLFAGGDPEPVKCPACGEECHGRCGGDAIALQLG